MEIANVINQTYNIINDIYWKYFNLNDNIDKLTKEQKYTLNISIEHIKENLKLIKKHCDKETCKEIIDYFNEMYNKNGIELKGE